MARPRTIARDHAGLELLRREQDHVVTRAQLATCGYRSRDVTDEVAAGRWRTYGHRVVLLTARDVSFSQRCRAGVLHAGPRANLAGLSTLELAGLRDWSRADIHVVVPSGLHVNRIPGLVVHRTIRLTASDVVELQGVPSTTPARAALDVARWDRSPRTANALIIAAVQQRLCTPEELDDALARFVKVKQQIAIGDGVADARDGAESGAEVIVAGLVVRAGFPRPRRQVEIRTSLGVRRFDLVVDLPDGRILTVEVDGPHHDDPAIAVVDAVKDAAVIELGGHPHRVRAIDAHERPWLVLRDLIDLKRRLGL